MTHPDRILDAAGAERLPAVEQVYPLVEGLASGHLRRAIEAALQRVPDLPEWIPGRPRQCRARLALLPRRADAHPQASLAA